MSYGNLISRLHFLQDFILFLLLRLYQPGVRCTYNPRRLVVLNVADSQCLAENGRASPEMWQVLDNSVNLYGNQKNFAHSSISIRDMIQFSWMIDCKAERKGCIEV